MSEYEYVHLFLRVFDTLQLLADQDGIKIDRLNLQISERSRWYLLTSPANFAGSKESTGFDRDVHKQRGRNVLLSLGVFRGRGSLRDEPRECLPRWLVFVLASLLSSRCAVSSYLIPVTMNTYCDWVLIYIVFSKDKSGVSQLFIWRLSVIKIIQHVSQILEVFVVSARNWVTL